MALSQKLEAYDDVFRVFRIAEINPNGAHIQMKSKNAAVRWRQRAYYFRKLWIGENKPSMLRSPDQEVRMKAGTSPWDDLVLTIDEHNVIHLRHSADNGILEIIAADGIMPEDDKLSPTGALDLMTGPAAPVVMAEGDLGIDVESSGFTEEQAEAARRAVAQIIAEG